MLGYRDAPTKKYHLVDRLHLVGLAEDPLFVGIGREVVGGRVVRGHVEEEVLVLRCSVLGPVWS